MSADYEPLQSFDWLFFVNPQSESRFFGSFEEWSTAKSNQYPLYLAHQERANPPLLKTIRQLEYTEVQVRQEEDWVYVEIQKKQSPPGSSDGDATLANDSYERYDVGTVANEEESTQEIYLGLVLPRGLYLGSTRGVGLEDPFLKCQE